MADYISRGAILAKCAYERPWGADAVIAMIEEFPAADVREVKRGKWDDDGCGWVRCSVCRGAIAVARGGNKFNFCPNCGADMREVGHSG